MKLETEIRTIADDRLARNEPVSEELLVDAVVALYGPKVRPAAVMAARNVIRSYDPLAAEYERLVRIEARGNLSEAERRALADDFRRLGEAYKVQEQALLHYKPS